VAVGRGTGGGRGGKGRACGGEEEGRARIGGEKIRLRGRGVRGIKRGGVDAVAIRLRKRTAGDNQVIIYLKIIQWLH
jgi:hypothetical protein